MKEKEKFIARVGHHTGMQAVVTEIISAAADAIERLEERIETLERTEK